MGMVTLQGTQGAALKPAKGHGPLDPVYKAIFLALLLIVLFASVAQAGEQVATFTDSMLQNFKDRFAAYEDKIWQAALVLFGLLFLCQFTWSVAQLCLHESLSFVAVVTVVVRQVMTGMFFYWLLFDRSILRGIVGSFSQLAQSGLSLSELVTLMEVAVLNILEAAGRSSGVIEGIALFLTGLSACVVMSFALTTAIAYMAIILLENYIVGSLGLILMGFGGSDYTRNYAMSYIRTLVHIGLKLFLATIIVQVGVIAFTQATIGLSSMDAESISQTCMRLIAQSFFFLAVTRVIPEIAGTLVSGASTTGMHTMYAIRGGGMAAAGAVTGAIAGAYNLPGAVADGYVKNSNAVESAVNAYSSRFDESRSKGHSSFVAGVSALGGVLWGAYQEDRQPQNSYGSVPKANWGEVGVNPQNSQNLPNTRADPTNPTSPTNPANPMNPKNLPQDNGSSGNKTPEQF
jgi:type IV secretion system protein TrbL